MAARVVAALKNGKLDKSFSKSLLSLLECPVCLEYMQPPITQCLNGHSICSTCRPKLDKCPSCRQPLTTMSRNVALEQIAEQCLKNDGKEFISADGKPTKQHRIYSCLCGLENECRWRGRRAELWQHVKESHSHLGFSLERNKLCFRLVKHNFSVNARTVVLLLAWNELFWYHFRQDCSSRKWYQSIQYIGPISNSSRFKYEFEFSSSDGKKKLVYSRETHSDMEDMAFVFQSGDCLSIDLNSVKHFVCENNRLSFKVKIDKI